MDHQIDVGFLVSKAHIWKQSSLLRIDYPSAPKLPQSLRFLYFCKYLFLSCTRHFLINLEDINTPPLTVLISLLPLLYHRIYSKWATLQFSLQLLHVSGEQIRYLILLWAIKIYAVGSMWRLAVNISSNRPTRKLFLWMPLRGNEACVYLDRRWWSQV